MRPTFVAQDTALARIPLGAAMRGPDAAGGEDSLLREAVFLASRQVRAPDASCPAQGRLACTWRGYEIRLRERTTPHGVFAGVAVARFADGSPRLRLGGEHRVRTTPSASWLAVLGDRALEDPGVLPQLVLTTSTLLTRRGGRYHSEQRGNGSWATSRASSVRVTEVTSCVIEACQGGAAAREVIAELRRRWPQASPQLAGHTLTDLIRAGVLLHDLLDDDPREDPLGHLLARLPACSALRRALRRLRDLLADADCHPPAAPARLRALTAARDAADQILPHERPLRADTVADASITLPRSLAQEAAEAAGLLWRIGWGSPPLAAYHAAFRERYGMHRWVPLLDATDPVTGLGTAEDADSIGPAAPDPRRDSALARLLATATAGGRAEIILDQDTVAELAAQDSYPPPRTAEIYVRVLAGTARDLEAGRFGLAICPGVGSQDAGSTAGRFAALLPGACESPDTDPLAVVAEIAVLPRTHEGASVAPVTGFAACRIPVGLPGHPGDLLLEDLLLASAGQHLIVWSARLQRRVIPVLYTRLASGLLPPLARFLALVGQGGARPWHGWSWRTSAPFTPAVRYRRTLLAPARWAIPPGLTLAAASPARWEPALDAWLADTRPAPPSRVITDDGDRHLPLDLSHRLDRELLRRYVRRGLPAVTGPLSGPGSIEAVLPGPRGRHLLDVAISLRSSDPARPAPHPDPQAVRAGSDGLHLPGQDWLALAVPALAAHQDEILSALSPVIARVAEHCDRWFWLRYRDEAHGTHLRVRFHGEPAALAAHVLPALSTWGAQLRRDRLSGGFSIVPYEQEIERYGGPAAIAAAESVFCADSALALGALAATGDADQRLVIAALSAAAIARSLAGGQRQPRDAVSGHRLGRAGRALAARLRPAARLADRTAAGPGLPQAVRAAWDYRQHALTAYRAILPSEQRTARASDLIHLHCNRMIPGADAERLARAIAADLLSAPGSGQTSREPEAS